MKEINPVTYMSLLVESVVGQLHLVEGDWSLHPLQTGGRRVRMDVHPTRYCGFRFPGYHLNVTLVRQIFDSYYFLLTVV